VRLSVVRDSAGLRPKRRVGASRRETGSRNRERKKRKERKKERKRIGMTKGLNP